MATPAQITANRLNAQKSTGPRSDEGKAVSRFNALKHAASARLSVIPGEDDDALAELADSYHQQFHPDGPEEALLLEKIIAADWTQRRMRRLEAEVLNALMAQQDPDEEHPLGAAFIKDCEGPNALQKIHRRYESASRDWLRSLTQLRALQSLRIINPQPLITKSAGAPTPGPRPPAPKTPPTAPPSSSCGNSDNSEAYIPAPVSSRSRSAGARL